MTAIRISGKDVAADVRAKVAAEVAKLPVKPCLAVILVGEDPASEVYVRGKLKDTEEAGMVSVHHRLPATASQTEVEDLIAGLNADESCFSCRCRRGSMQTRRSSGSTRPRMSTA